MLEAEITGTGGVLVEGQAVGELHGFRFVPDPGVGGDGSEAKALKAAAQQALSSEFDKRAEKISKAPNEEIVLSTDGSLRWLGEPVGRLVAGDDTLAPKVALIAYCLRHKIKIVSSMGAGGRKDPSAIRIADIADTYHCALAKAVRLRLRKEGISKGLKTVFSTEQADRNAVVVVEGERNKKSTVGTISYLPAIFGCYLAGHVIRKLTEV